MNKRLAGWLLPLLWLGLSLGVRAEPTATAKSTDLEQSLQYVLDGRADSALTRLNHHIESHPDDPRGYLARGTLLANIMKEPRYLEVALRDFDRVSALDPQPETWFWLLRGRLLQRLERHAAAVQDLDRFIAIDTGYPDAYFLRGRSQWLLGNGQLAEKDLDRALQLSPMLAEAYGLRGIVRLQLGQADGGLQDLKDAVDLDPNCSYAEDLKVAARRKVSADGLSWVPFRSPEGDFQVELPMPVRTTTKDDQYMVASALAAGHMFGVIRHPHDSESKLWKIDSEECRETVMNWLQARGGKMIDWSIQPYAGKRCLHACMESSDGTETDVILVLGKENIYLVAAVRPPHSPPFELARKLRFYRSFRLLK